METNSLSICDFLFFPLLQLFDIYCTPAHESSRSHLSDFNTTALFYHLQTLLRSTCHKTGVPPVCTRTLLPCCSSKIWFPLKIGRLCLPACMKLSISSPGEVSSKRPACLSNPLPIARVLFFFFSFLSSAAQFPFHFHFTSLSQNLHQHNPSSTTLTSFVKPNKHSQWPPILRVGLFGMIEPDLSFFRPSWM